jgi:hypothetical protein
MVVFLLGDVQVTRLVSQKFPRLAPCMGAINFVLHLAGEVLVNKSESRA